MAKKKHSQDLFNSLDFAQLTETLGTLRETNSKIAPSEKEAELVTSGKGELREIPTAELRPYHRHTFRVLDDDDMAELVDSIKDNGIVTPISVRELNGGGFEILAGHRRHFAATKLGLEMVPCLIVDADDDMADIIMADSNLARTTILPSEKAHTYKVRLEAAVRQGKRTEAELKALADESPDSLTGIRRYLKLNDLTPALLDKVDDGSIPLTAGVTLAGFSESHQKAVETVITENDIPLSIKDVEKLKKATARGLTRETVESVLKGKLTPRAAKKKQPKAPVFKEDMLADVVPDSIKELPLEDRVEYYKAAIRAFNS